MTQRLRDWFYQFKHGHPFLLDEEVEIIINTRDDKKYTWMNDREIQKLIQIRIEQMYKARFPNAKKWRLP